MGCRSPLICLRPVGPRSYVVPPRPVIHGTQAHSAAGCRRGIRRRRQTLQGSVAAGSTKKRKRSGKEAADGRRCIAKARPSRPGGQTSKVGRRKKGAVTLSTAPPLDHAGEDRFLRVP